MALNWPENPRLIGTRIPRLDGLLKASGRAKYPSDTRPDGMLFAVMLYSPHAHAKVKSIASRFDKLTFKYTGPWPPYNFVNIRLKLERA